MVVYSCHCLNVRIFAEKLEGTQNSDVLATCPLGSSCDLVELIDQGFYFNHKCLVHRVRNKDWTVYTCVSCRMQTHAVNLDTRLVVVSSKMEKGEEAIRLIKSSPNFSPVFNLLLHPSDERQTDLDGIQSQSYEILQKRLGDLQAALSKYLKQEEEAMEMRIRDYEEMERIKFARLKEQAQHDKTKLISVLFQNSEGSRSVTSTDMSLTQGNVLLSHSRSADEHDKEVTSPRKINDKLSRRMRDSSPDVFTMDELRIDDVGADYESSASTNRSEKKRRSDKLKGSYVQQSGRIRTPGLETTDETESGHEEVSLMSTSVPISMPANAHSRRNTSYLDEYEESTEFDDIPRNMQALSESIQEHDRYIFGDRPRQRVHTGDFSQVNWH